MAEYKATGRSSTYNQLSGKLTELKREPEHLWLNEVSRRSLAASLRNLDRAYQRFYEGKAKYPKFRSKKRKNSFQVADGTSVDFENGTVSILKVKNIPAVIDRKFDGRIKTTTITRTPTGKYFISLNVEMEGELPPKPPIKRETSIGIDVGLKSYIATSRGEKIDNPKCLGKSQRRLKRNQRKLSRRKPESKRREKQRHMTARIYERITNRRDDFLHKLSYKLTHENQVDTIIVEDLSIRGLMKNHSLAGSISDASWGKFFRFLKYKCDWYGKNLLACGMLDPTSKKCNHCGYINNSLKLSDRTWVCPQCGKVLDRDINAAKNILDYGLNRYEREGSTAGSAGINAQGDTRSMIPASLVPGECR